MISIGQKLNAPLTRALAQSHDVKAKVEECADAIGTTNVVMEADIAQGVTTISASNTLAAGKEVESRVQECADDLHEVTETLAKGIDDLARPSRPC